MIMPKILQDRIIAYLKQGKRFDARKTDEYRQIEVKTGISNNAEGSASVKFGKTEVYAGVKLSAAEPYSDGPEDGTFTCSMELSPMASADYELGPPGIESVEMGRIIDRGIRESKFIDFSKLCIKSGEKVWAVYLDLYAVNNDGNLLDVAAMAALVALANAKMPVYNEKEEKVEHEHTNEGLPLNKNAMAFNMTFHKIDDHIIVDPSKEEEEISDYRISLAACYDENEKPRITSIQKGKEGAITAEEMEKILNLVELKLKELHPKISKFVWGK